MTSYEDRISGSFVVDNPTKENLLLFNEHWEKFWSESDLDALLFVLSNVKRDDNIPDSNSARISDLLKYYTNETGKKVKSRGISHLLFNGGFGIYVKGGRMTKFSLLITM